MSDYATNAEPTTDEKAVHELIAFLNQPYEPHIIETAVSILSRHRSDQVERLTKALLHVRQRFADYWWNPDDGGGGDMRKVPEAVDEALASEGKTETGNTQGSAENAGSDLMSRQALPTGVTAGETASSSPPPAESVTTSTGDHADKLMTVLYGKPEIRKLIGGANAELLKDATTTIERLEGEVKTIRDARKANLGLCDYCGGTIWGVSGFVEMEKLRLHPLCVERRSVNRLSINLAQTEASLTSLQSKIERLEADPRLRCPLDGPGSHRMDLLELRSLQSRLDAAEKVIEAIVEETDNTESSEEESLRKCETFARDYLSKQERT